MKLDNYVKELIGRIAAKVEAVELDNEFDVLNEVQCLTQSVCLEIAKHDGHALQFVNLQTREICLAAVRQNGLALEHVFQQTTEIVAAAVEQTPHAVFFAKEQPIQLCLKAVRRNPYVLRHVRKQSAALAMVAVKRDGQALQWVADKTLEICFAALMQSAKASEFIPASISAEVNLRIKAAQKRKDIITKMRLSRSSWLKLFRKYGQPMKSMNSSGGVLKIILPENLRYQGFWIGGCSSLGCLRSGNLLSASIYPDGRIDGVILDKAKWRVLK